MNTWKNYWHRSAIVIVIFINLLVCTSASLAAYRLLESSLPPILYLMWTVYFFILLALIISHKKKNIRKAILNVMIMVLALIPLSGIGIPLSLVTRPEAHDTLRGSIFIFLSLISLLILLIRHERWTIKDAIRELYSYVMEMKKYGWRSSFSKYLISEISAFILLTISVHIYLSI